MCQYANWGIEKMNWIINKLFIGHWYIICIGILFRREFIRDELDGCLFSVLFNQQGRAFAGYYYGEGDSPYYPADIDDYALKYFGPSRYHSNEFQQEAYLFIPFDEKYYQTTFDLV